MSASEMHFQKGDNVKILNGTMDKYEEQLANFIAHVQADGSFMPKTNSFRYYNKDLKLMDQFANLSMVLFGVQVWKYYRKSNGCFETGFSNKTVAKQLGKHSFRCHEWEIPAFVKNGSDEAKMSYLQAFFDDESNVLFRRKKEGHDREIKMMLANKKGLFGIQSLLKSLGIESHVYGPFRGKYYDLKISHRRNLEQFRDKIGFSESKKKEKLEAALGSYLNLNRTY